MKGISGGVDRVMDVKRHDRLHEKLAMLRLLAQSQDSLAKSGRVYSSDEVRRRAKAVLERAKKRRLLLGE